MCAFPIYTISVLNPLPTDLINAGDDFNYFLINNLSNNYYKDFTRDGPGYIGNTRFIFCGSLATDSNKYSILCGCGIIVNSVRKINDFEECYGVRGRFTLEAIKNCKPSYDISNVVLGDPGLLLPWFINNNINVNNNKYKYGIILHYIDKKYVKEYFMEEFLNNNLIIDIQTNDFYKLSKQINECETIIASSLHGLIFANSFNKSVIWIELEKSQLTKDNIKFYDYFSVFNVDTEKLNNKVNYIIDNDNINNLTKITLDKNELYDKQWQLLENMKKIFKKYNFKFSDRYNFKLYRSIGDNNQNAAYYMKELIMSNKKFKIGRIGGCELECLEYFSDNNLELLEIPDNFHERLQYLYMYKNCGYYDVKHNKLILKKFLEEIIQYYIDMELLLVANINSEKYCKLACENEVNTFKFPIYRNYKISKFINEKNIANYLVIENFFNLHIWFPALENKKILIISPFSEEIKNQLKIKDNLYTNNTSYNQNLKEMKYPTFKSVQYLQTYLTTNNFETPHDNIMETCEEYYHELDNKDFDIALLMCGAYSYPLSNYIYDKLNKSSIHLGGVGQLLFGIIGPRYETDYFKPLMNDNWIYPYKTVTCAYGKGSIDYKRDSLSAYFNPHN